MTPKWPQLDWQQNPSPTPLHTFSLTPKAQILIRFTLQVIAEVSAIYSRSFSTKFERMSPKMTCFSQASNLSVVWVAGDFRFASCYFIISVNSALCCFCWYLQPTSNKFYLILSYLILSYLILSYLIISYLVLSCLVLSCLVLSCLVLSCLALPCLALPYLVLSCLTLPYLISSYLIFYLILSYRKTVLCHLCSVVHKKIRGTRLQSIVKNPLSSIYLAV